MNNSIFAVSHNNIGEVVDVEFKYLDTDAVFDTLVKLLTNERDVWCNDEDLHGWHYDDEEIKEYALMLVSQFNGDMKKYLHQSDHKISGNFNNLDYDYNYHKCGIVSGKYDTNKIGGNDYDLADCIKRLDKGEDTEDARTDRQALTDWFWDTFGTWGICYDFTEHLNCSYENYCYCNDIKDDD